MLSHVPLQLYVPHLFFFNNPPTTEIYILSQPDALPTYRRSACPKDPSVLPADVGRKNFCIDTRSEEHTSELQSQSNIVCRLLLEKRSNGPVILERAHVHRRSRPRWPVGLNTCVNAMLVP